MNKTAPKEESSAYCLQMLNASTDQHERDFWQSRYRQRIAVEQAQRLNRLPPKAQSKSGDACSSPIASDKPQWRIDVTLKIIGYLYVVGAALVVILVLVSLLQGCHTSYIQRTGGPDSLKNSTIQQGTRPTWGIKSTVAGCSVGKTPHPVKVLGANGGLSRV